MNDAEHEDTPLEHRRIVGIICALLLAWFISVIGGMMISNALPVVVADLKGTSRNMPWVVTVVLLTATATLPIWGKLADLVNKKTLFQSANVIFIGGTILAAFAQDMESLIAFRAVQGIGMGGLQGLTLIIIGVLVSPRERARYNGYLSVALALATTGAPLIGGLIVDTPWLGWRWCFCVCLPAACASMIILARTLHLPTIRRPVRIDYVGATLIPAAITVLLLWTSLVGRNFGWVSYSTLGYVGAAAIMLVIAVVVQFRVSEPVLPPRLFRDRTVTLALLASIGVGTAMTGCIVFLAQYYQVARGFSAVRAGTLVLPMMIGLVVSSMVSGHLINKYGRWKSFLVAGGILSTVGLSLLGTIDHDTNLTLMGGYLVFLGLGQGMLMQNLILPIQNGVHHSDIGAASSTMAFTRALGGAAGTTVLGAVLSTGLSDRLAGSGAQPGGGESLDLDSMTQAVRETFMAAYGDAMSTPFRIAAILAAIGLVAVVLIKEVPLRRTTTVSDSKFTRTAASRA